MDHTYALRLICNLFLSKNLKLSCCFTNYAKAFDSVWGDGLLLKLLKSGIEGIFFNIMKNMYSGIRSRVFLNGENFAYLTPHEGIRQGKTFSPFLFSLFINYIEKFVLDSGVNYLKFVDNINGWLRLLILLYADAMVEFANTPYELQEGINAIEKYCNMWQLTAKNMKTKVIIFWKRNYGILPQFYPSDNQLKILNAFLSTLG